MNELERAGAALRDRPPMSPALDPIQRRATALRRRRRVGWTAVVAAVAVVVAVIGLGTMRDRSNDESIVVGPSPDPNGSLTMALRGVADQATADEVASAMRDRIGRLDRQGVGISKDDADPRVAVDMTQIAVRASPTSITVTGPEAVLARVSLAPVIWSSGHPSFVIVRSDAGPEIDGCAPGQTSNVGIEQRCYAVDEASISVGLDEDITHVTPSSMSALLVAWKPGPNLDLVRRIAAACGELDPTSTCPEGMVAIRLADGRLGAFFMEPPASADGMPILTSQTFMSFDDSLAWAATLSRPLPIGVSIDPPPTPEYMMVATARGILPSGRVVYADANVVQAPVAVALIPPNAITRKDRIDGRTTAVEIRDQSVIVEEMLD
jgi:hypothetical protein